MSYVNRKRGKLASLRKRTPPLTPPKKKDLPPFSSLKKKKQSPLF
jgi:hypothetical protein